MVLVGYKSGITLGVMLESVVYLYCEFFTMDAMCQLGSPDHILYYDTHCGGLHTIADTKLFWVNPQVKMALTKT